MFFWSQEFSPPLLLPLLASESLTPEGYTGKETPKPGSWLTCDLPCASAAPLHTCFQGNPQKWTFFGGEGTSKDTNFLERVGAGGQPRESCSVWKGSQKGRQSLFELLPPSCQEDCKSTIRPDRSIGLGHSYWETSLAPILCFCHIVFT